MLCAATPAQVLDFYEKILDNIQSELAGNAHLPRQYCFMVFDSGFSDDFLAVSLDRGL